MSKRGFSAFAAAGPGDWTMARALLSEAEESEVALGFIPGQFEDVYVPRTINVDPPRATSFTTVALYAPLSALRAILTGPFRLLHRVARHQRIRVEDVDRKNPNRADGARKKILLDAGHEPATPKHKSSNNPAPARRNNGGNHASRPSLWEPLPGDAIYTPTSLPDRDGIGFTTPEEPDTPIDNGLWELDDSTVNISPYFDGTQISGTPDYKRNAAAGPATPTPSHISPEIIRILPTKPFQHKRVTALAGTPRMHTKASPTPIRTVPTPVPRQCRPVNFKEQVEETANKAHEASDAYKARKEAQASFNQTTTTDDLSMGSNVDGPSMANSIRTTSSYDNDMSILPDAPEIKVAAFDDNVRVKHFHDDEPAFELLDSYLDVLKRSPEEELEEPDVDESSISLEAAEALRQETLSSPEYQKKKAALAAPPPPPPQEVPAPEPNPPFPRVDGNTLKVILKVSEETKGGRIQKDIVPQKITTHDLKTLLPTEFNGSPTAWLNDAIVDEYMTLLVEHVHEKAGYRPGPGAPAPPVHAFPSQWYTSASKDIRNVRRWAKRKHMEGKKLLDVQLLLIPICDHGHWRLLAIKPQDRTVEYLDSLEYDGTMIIRTAFAWLKQELGPLWVESQWKVVQAQRSRQQLNGRDCGVFTCGNAVALIRNEDPNILEVDDGMNNARRRIAVSLISRKLTGEL